VNKSRFRKMGTNSTKGKDEVSQSLKLGYGTGHMLNDLCASMWFTYLLIYFHRVLGFSNSYAGIVMVVGQVSDGSATIVIGYLQDKGKDLWLCRVYDKRKGWHLVGTIGLALSFPFIFNKCVGCSSASDNWQLFYYCIFVVIIQFSWPCAQISHLALIPDMTNCKTERTKLTSYRYCATILSNLIIYLSMWALLGPLSSKNRESIGPNEAPVFRDVAIFAVGLGSFTSLVFHIVVRVDGSGKFNGARDSLLLASEEYVIMSEGGEQNVEVEEHIQSFNFPVTSFTKCSVQSVSKRGKGDPMRLLDWLKEPQLYQVCYLYLSSRVFVNLSQAYMTLYLDFTLKLKPERMALIPLMMYLASLFTSAFMNKLTGAVGRKSALLVAALLGLGGAVLVWFGDYADTLYTTKLIFIVALLFGAGGSAMLITTIAATADFIGGNMESSALIFGITSLVDKMGNAVAFGVIQDHVPNDDAAARNYYRDILVFVCGGAMIFVILIWISMLHTKLGRRHRDHTCAKSIST
jgi:Na+/melibiose symporter-like transporter